MSEWEPLPEDVREILEEHRRQSGPCGDCLRCEAACCATSGPAVGANVSAACEAYDRGWLSYQFEPGLEAREFALTYFDTVLVTPADAPDAGMFPVFFPRSLVDGQSLVCISPVEDGAGKVRALTLREYEAVREYHREQSAPHPWRCVFCSPSVARGDVPGRTFTGCLLHVEESATCLTAKPLDCVLRSCRKPPDLVAPEPMLYRRWLEALGRHWGRPGGSGR
jgi:hypothetical protein